MKPVISPFEQPDCRDFRTVARALTIVENDLAGAAQLLRTLRSNDGIPVTGITGAPGAGKSTLVNALISELLKGGKKVAVLAVDPTSPFNFGSLLGDRIRMAEHFNSDRVFIRSLATRGSLGGLSAKIIEMTDVLKAARFDHILIETVGVGQSEVEIAGLADITLVVLVPEGGDEIQNIKSGIMEIADVFVVNKADREGADLYFNTLKKIIDQKVPKIPIFKTVASQNQGIEAIAELIRSNDVEKKRKDLLLTEKAYQIIRQRRMADVDKAKLQQAIVIAASKASFNLYRFLDGYLSGP